MYPEASRDDIKTLLHMARPKDYVPKAKPDQGVSQGRVTQLCDGPSSELLRQGTNKAGMRAGRSVVTPPTYAFLAKYVSKDCVDIIWLNLALVAEPVHR